MSLRDRFVKLVTGAGVALLAAAASAGVLAPGGTMSPVDSGFVPSGVQLATGTVNFSLHFSRVFPSPPLNLNTTGHVTYRVYQLPDNTLTFTYLVTDDANSDTIISQLGLTNFASFTTDVNYALSFVPSGDPPTSATRSSTGSAVTYLWDQGFTGTARTVWIKTNATAYTLTGAATLAMFPNGDGAATIGGMPRPVTDSTAPVATLSSPGVFADVCGGGNGQVAITGSANDPQGFVSYTVDYATGPNGPWTVINTAQTPVTNGSLGTWNTSALAQGFYFLRLTAINTSDVVSTATTVVFLDKQFDAVVVRSPQSGNIYGGTICFDGTIDDGDGGVLNHRIDYAPLPAASPFLPIIPAQPTFAGGVVNDPMALGQGWNTASGPSAVPDGNYRIRVRGTDTCGFSLDAFRDVIVDNTAPIARIDSPLACSALDGVVPVTGVVSDAHIGAWVLQYSGGNSHGWINIASGNGNVSGLLGNWNTSGLRPCAYALRLIATDLASVNCGGTSHETEFVTLVNVGRSCPIDFNFDGEVNPDDLGDFITAYFSGGCP